jgi:CHAT domain-containing protein
MPRYFVAFAAVLFAWPLVAQEPAEANRSVTFFLHAWLPEIGPLPSPPTIEEAALVGVANASLQGDFLSAQRQLATIAETSRDARTQYLVPLWSREIARRRFRFAGSAALLDIDSGIVRIHEGPTRQRELDQARSIAGRMLPPETNQVDAIGQATLLMSLCIEASLNGAFTQLGRGTLAKFAPELDQGCKDRLTTVFTVGGQPTLTDPSYSLLRDLAAVRSATRLHDDAGEARRTLEAGLAVAERNHWTGTAALWMLALADAYSAPRGSSLTFGYELASERLIRTELNVVANSMGLGGEAQYESRDLTLEAAAAMYQKANGLNQSTHGPIPASDFVLREAFLDFRRGRPAYEAYRRAAVLAKAEGSVWTEIMASVCASLLSNSRQGLADALAIAVKQGNVGAVVSMAQLTESWAARAAVQGDRLAAATRLRLAADALARQGFEDARAEVLNALAETDYGLERYEAAVEDSKQALSDWDTLLQKVESAGKEPKVGQDAIVAALAVQPTQIWPKIADRWSNLAGIYGLLESREGLAWTIKKNQAWEEASKRFATSPIGDAAASEMLKQLGNQFKNDLPSRLPELSKFRTLQTCGGILNYFKTLIPQVPRNQKDYSTMVMVLASGCDPTLLETARKGMEQLDLVGSIAAAWKSAQGPWGLNRARFQQAIDDADEWMSLADSAGGGLLLSRWVSGLEPVLRQVPGYNSVRPLLTYRKARALALNGDAAGARELLLAIRRESYWAHAATSDFRQDVLRALLEVEVQLGQAEAALLETEEIRAEKDRDRRLATGIDESSPESVELAMLLRQAALAQNVDQARLAELEQRATTSVEGKAPNLASLHTSVRSLPPDTTALVYFPLRNELAIWRLERNAPPRLIRVPAASERLLLNARRFRAILASGEAGWEEMAQPLYEILMKPVGPIPSGRTIAVSGADLLGNIPFEMLRPAESQPLVMDHPIIYLGNLSAAPHTPNANRASRSALVVGINGGGLSAPEEEARMVASLLRTAPLTGAAATTMRVEQALAGAQYIHFATHGVVDAGNPYRSYLAMFDGQLEAWKLLRKATQAELIVLSACNTKLGPQRILKQVTSDEDSITGLASYGGARRILASLWGADDGASSRLMDSFYRELGKYPSQPALALQRAKTRAVSEGFQPNQYANFVLSVRGPDAILISRQP